MMFQGRPVEKGKNVVGEYETIWNNEELLNHEMNHRRFLSNGSEYFSGGRFINENDEILYSVRRNNVMDMKNSNRYDLNEFDLCDKFRDMHVGNGSNDRFGESSYSRANYPGFDLDDRKVLSFPGLFHNTNPSNLSLNHSENPYLSRNHYQLQNPLKQSDHGENSFQIPPHWENNNDLYLLRRQNSLLKMDGSEDSLVLDGNLSSNHRSDKNCGGRNASQKNSFYKNDSSSSYLPNSTVQYQNYIYAMAKDQQGCRFLQRRLGEETDEGVQILFNEIIGHIVELMMDPFGNYLVQKVLEICDKEQQSQIVLMVTQVPGDLVRVSLNPHGTRAVQKLIETIKTRQQISLVIMALKPGFLDLVKDPNGNHVIQLCLEQFTYEDNKFIFNAAERFCVPIATHQHGCCVMNRCIAHSVGRDREILIGKVAANGLKLAQDAYGNYVVQYVIELKIPSVAAILMSQFEGNFCSLSTQKFSSHVIEKCLKFIEYSRPRIVNELLNAPRFDQLLQDPFANYVIRSALDNTSPKSHVHVSLKKAVNAYPSLRMSPYCKKIFSHNRVKT